MKYSFSIVSPDEVKSNLKAIEYLELGASNFGGIISVAKMIHNYSVGKDILVFVKFETKLRGAIYLTVTQQETGKVLTSVLLGGDHFHDWASELKEFYYKLAKDHNCDEFMMMGRHGFKRYFSELKEVATVFRVILKEPVKNIK